LHQPHDFQQDIDESNAAKIAAARELADQAVADLAENSDATIPYARETLRQLRRADAVAAPHFVSQAQAAKSQSDKLQRRFKRLSDKYTKLKAENAANTTTIAWLRMRLSHQEERLNAMAERAEVAKWYKDVISDLHTTCKSVLGL
jgi:chromosome segregation ATPase